MNAQEAKQLTQQARDREVGKVLDRIKAQATLGYDSTQTGPLWPQTVEELKRLGYTVSGDGSYTKVEWT